MKVTILGMGEIGGALMHVLKNQKDVEVVGWDKNASKFPQQRGLQDSLKGADLVFLCVPSWNLRGALVSITPDLPTTAGLVSLAKGIEKESCRTSDELLQESFPEHPFGVLGGPMIAEEMLGDKLTSGVLATTSPQLRTLMRKLFKGSHLRIVTTSDIHGTTLCGILKNAFTLSIGIAEGLGLGENAKGTLFSHALSEMRTIVKYLGGKTPTVLGLAGAGDFYATSQSAHSRNRKVGIVLGTGGDGHLESEGFMSLVCLEKLIPVQELHVPLFASLLKIAHQQAPAEIITEAIFDHHLH